MAVVVPPAIDSPMNMQSEKGGPIHDLGGVGHRGPEPYVASGRSVHVDVRHRGLSSQAARHKEGRNPREAEGGLRHHRGGCRPLRGLWDLGYGHDLVKLDELRVGAGGVVGEIRRCACGAHPRDLPGVGVGEDAEEERALWLVIKMRVDPVLHDQSGVLRGIKTQRQES